MSLRERTRLGLGIIEPGKETLPEELFQPVATQAHLAPRDALGDS